MKKTRLGLATATALASVVAVAGVNSASAATSTTDTSFSAKVDGQFAGISGTIGPEGSLLTAHAKFGTGTLVVDSKGVTKAGSAKLPAGSKVGSSIDIVSAGALGLTLPLGHTQASAPVASGPSSTSFPNINIPGLVYAGLPQVTTTANYGTKVFGPKKAGEVGTISGSSLGFEALDLTKLGVPAAILPSQLRGPIISTKTTDLRGQVTSTLNNDGTHGLRATGQGGLGYLQLFGGATKGGISLDLFSAENGDKYVAGTQAWATGKKGGAGCSYTNPDVVGVQLGGNHAGFHAGIGQRIPFAGFGWFDVEFTGKASCTASADGTSAVATGAGVGVRLHLEWPGGITLFDGFVTLPDLNVASVKVPKGGITKF